MADTPSGINTPTLGALKSGLGAYSGRSSGSSGGSSSGSRTTEFSTLTLNDFLDPDVDNYERRAYTNPEDVEISHEVARTWYEQLWEDTKKVGATIVVGATSIVSGVLDVGEALMDGVVTIAAGAMDLVGLDDAADATREFVKRDLVSEANDALYGEGGLLQAVNETSALKYDSELAQGIRNTTAKVTKFAAETALMAIPGAGPFLAAGFGGLTALGEGAEDSYNEYGIHLTTGQRVHLLGVTAAGCIEGYFNGKMGLNLINGAKAIGAGKAGSFVKNAWTGMKHFDWRAASETFTQTMTSGKTWAIAGGQQAGKVFDLAADWIDTGETNINDWVAVGGDMLKSATFQSAFAAGSSGIAQGRYNYETKVAEELDAQKTAAYNARMDEMTPEERSKAWQEHFGDDAEHLSGVDVRGHDGSFYDMEALGESYNNLDRLCAEHGITRDDFIRMANQPIHTLAPADQQTMAQIRMELTADVTDSAGHVLPGTKVSKAIPAGNLKYYQDGGSASIRGCAGLARDQGQMATGADVVDRTGLRFTGTGFVDGSGTGAVEDFYIVEGDVGTPAPGETIDLRVRISSTTNAVPATGGLTEAQANAQWTANAQANAANLASYSGMSQGDIFIEDAGWANHPFPDQLGSGSNIYSGNNPDIGSGYTYGYNKPLGIPEFSSGSSPVPIVNGTIYQVHGNQRIPIATIDGTGTIHYLNTGN